MFWTYLDAVRNDAISRVSDELDPADGLALLSASHFIMEWVAGGRGGSLLGHLKQQLSIWQAGHSGPIHRAILVLEFASRRSPHNYQFRLLLIRLYLAVGASI